MGSTNNNNNNVPSRLERSLSLTSEPRTLTKTQYELAIASMQASEKQRLAVLYGTTTDKKTAAKGKVDRGEGTSGTAPAANFPA